MKTNKAYTKRIRVTKKGKLVVRKAGQNHYNAFENGGTKTRKKRAQSMVMTNRTRRRFLAGK